MTSVKSIALAVCPPMWTCSPRARIAAGTTLSRRRWTRCVGGRSLGVRCVGIRVATAAVPAGLVCDVAHRRDPGRRAQGADQAWERCAEPGVLVSATTRIGPFAPGPKPWAMRW